MDGLELFRKLQQQRRLLVKGEEVSSLYSYLVENRLLDQWDVVKTMKKGTIFGKAEPRKEAVPVIETVEKKYAGMWELFWREGYLVMDLHGYYSPLDFLTYAQFKIEKSNAPEYRIIWEWQENLIIFLLVR